MKVIELIQRLKQLSMEKEVWLGTEGDPELTINSIVEYGDIVMINLQEKDYGN